jgi:hypothetical protein
MRVRAQRRCNIAPQHSETIMWILIAVWLISTSVFLFLAHRAPTLSDDGVRYVPRPARLLVRSDRRTKPLRD